MKALGAIKTSGVVGPPIKDPKVSVFSVLESVLELPMSLFKV